MIRFGRSAGRRSRTPRWLRQWRPAGGEYRSVPALSSRTEARTPSTFPRPLRARSHRPPQAIYAGFSGIIKGRTAPEQPRVGPSGHNRPRRSLRGRPDRPGDRAVPPPTCSSRSRPSTSPGIARSRQRYMTRLLTLPSVDGECRFARIASPICQTRECPSARNARASL